MFTCIHCTSLFDNNILILIWGLSCAKILSVLGELDYDGKISKSNLKRIINKKLNFWKSGLKVLIYREDEAFSIL